MNKFIFILVFIVYSFSAFAQSYQDASRIINTNEIDPAEIFKANKLTVMIKNESKKYKEVGSGILIGIKKNKVYVISAKHAVTGIPKDSISIHMKGGFRYDGNIEYIADNLDLVVISFQPDSFIHNLISNNEAFNMLSYRNEAVIDPGIRIYLTGNPKGENWRFYKEKPGDIFSKKNNLYKFNSKHIENGHSGGGLFEQVGSKLYLIGMIIRKRNKSTGDAYYIRSILEHLEKNAVNVPISLNVVRNHAIKLNRDGYIMLPHRKMLNQLSLNGELTLEGWLKIKSTGNFTFPFIEKGWGLKVDPHLGALFYASRNGPSAPSMVRTPKNKWFHLAVTYSKSRKQVKFYINGLLVSNVPYTRSLSYNWEPLSLGFSSRVEPNQLAWGSIDEVRVWNYVRSDKQIKNNFNKVISMLKDGCLLYWRLDEGGGYIAEDFNGLNGVAVGSINWIKSNVPLDYKGTGWTR